MLTIVLTIILCMVAFLGVLLVAEIGFYHDRETARGEAP